MVARVWESRHNSCPSAAEDITVITHYTLHPITHETLAQWLCPDQIVRDLLTAVKDKYQSQTGRSQPFRDDVINRAEACFDCWLPENCEDDAEEDVESFLCLLCPWVGGERDRGWWGGSDGKEGEESIISAYLACYWVYWGLYIHHVTLHMLYSCKSGAIKPIYLIVLNLNCTQNYQLINLFLKGYEIIYGLTKKYTFQELLSL